MNSFAKHDWSPGEPITEEKLDRIENGVYDVTEEVKAISTKVGSETLNSNYSSIINAINTLANIDVNTVEESMYTYYHQSIRPEMQAALSSAEAVATGIQTQFDNLVTSIYGSTTIYNGNESSLKDWITAQLNNLNIDTINTNINALTSSYNNLTTNVSTILGSDYYNNGWITTGSTITSRLDTLESQTVDVEKTLGVQLNTNLTAPSTTISSSLYSMITDIQTVLNGAGSGGLIEKIEGALGRSLALQENETITSGEYSNSLHNQLLDLRQEIFGSGDSSSTHTLPSIIDDLYGDSENSGLIADVDTILDTIDGYNNQLSDIDASITSISAQFSSYTAAINRSLDAYVDADRTKIGEDYYLVLKRDAEVEQYAATPEAMQEDTLNTYVLMPQGGGGGGATYGYTPRFDVVRPATTPIIVTGDEYIIRYKWIVLDGETETSEVSGNLTLYVNNAAVYTESIKSSLTSSEYSTLDVTSYLTTGTNSLRITVNSTDTGPKSFYYTIKCIYLNLTSTFNKSAIQTGSQITYQYTAAAGDATLLKTLHIKLNGSEVTLTNNASTSERLRSVSFNTPSAGTYILEAYFTVTIDGVAEPISSNILRYGIICGLSPYTRIVTDFIDGTEIVQYNNLVVNYLIETPGANSSNVTLTISDNADLTNENTTIYFTHEDVVGTEYVTWTYPLNFNMDQGTDTLQLYVTIASDNVSKVLNFILKKNTQYNFSSITEDLKLYLTADQRSNNEPNHDKWSNSAPNGANVTVTLNNFLYYGDVDGWQKDANDKYFLRLRNKAKVLINYPVFNFNYTNGLITDGMTFELDFKTSDVTDYDTTILSCYEQGKENDAGAKKLIFTAQQATFSNTVTLSTQYKEEEKITVTFVVNPGQTANNDYKLVFIYINGILSAAIEYTDILNFANMNKGIIEIGSEECTTDIYSIRVYNRALKADEIIQNWISNTGNYIDRINYYIRNQYPIVDGTQIISFEKFQDSSPNTPYMVISGYGDWNDSNAMPTTKDDGTYTTTEQNIDKKLYSHGIKVEYVNPLHNEYSFTTDFDEDNIHGEVGVAIQGTSSQEYLRKNYKIKLTNFKQNGVYHQKKNGTNDDTHSTQGYKLSANSLPTWTFCIKADVASSESVNNTYLVGLYDEVVRNFIKTPPQADDARIRQGVEGYPMVCWYHNLNDDSYILLGKYNFNNDKGTEEVYGFITGDESWEVKNNENPLCFFETNNDDWTNWHDAFETRFPDDDKAMTNGTYSSAEIEDRLAGLKQVVNWVNGIVEWDDSTTRETITSASVTSFKNGFENYFNLRAMLFFYVFTEFFLMVDNRAKNMFLTRYLVNNNRPEDAAWHTNTATTTLNKNTSTDDNYFGWFSLPYDFDTALGINNVGVYTFDYHYEGTDYQAGHRPVFNGQNSKLWAAFRQAYKEEIKTTFESFFNFVSYEQLNAAYDAAQSIWSEAIFNEDMRVKYIDWRSDSRALPMLLGSKKEQRKWWLDNRFKYFRSKYALDQKTDNVSLGLQNGSYTIPISVYADSYVTINVGANDSSPITHRVLRGETVTFQRNASSSDEVISGGGLADRVESAISPASRLKSIENLAGLNLINCNFSKATRLQTLKIGSGTTTNANLKSINVSNNILLRLFDLRNCTGYTATLDLSRCLSLQYVYLAGTQMTTVNLPEGGVLTTVQYPTTINDIKIINQPYLKNLIIGAELPYDEIYTDELSSITSFDGINNYSNITNLYLDNVGTTREEGEEKFEEDLKILSAMISGLEPNNTNDAAILATRHVYLNGVDWTLTANEFKTIFYAIKKMHGYEEKIASATAPARIIGTLRLTGEVESDFIAEIGEYFGNDLKLYHEENEYFTVAFSVPFDPNGDISRTEYVIKGHEAVSAPTSILKSDEYLTAYNQNYNPGWTWGATTRQGFKEWDTSFNNVQSNLVVRPVMDTQYRMDFQIQTSVKDVYNTIYKYFGTWENIEPPQMSAYEFEREYYHYTGSDWTLTPPGANDYYIDTGMDERTPISTTIQKSPIVEIWYAMYIRSPQHYSIKLYNTNLNGEKYGEPLLTLDKTVIGGTLVGNTVSRSELITPSEINQITIVGGELEKDLPDEERTCRFLGWRPYIPSSAGLEVTGNMDILLTYYNVNDYFTNYFLNKLVDCDLVTNAGVNKIYTLPEGAFFHNSNLKRLKCEARNIGDYSFANYGFPTASLSGGAAYNKIFIFNGTNETIQFGKYCFWYIQDAIILFTGRGPIKLSYGCFSNMQRCYILAPNSEYPITLTAGTQRQDACVNFGANSNLLFVKEDVKPLYLQDSTVPSALIAVQGQYIHIANENDSTYTQLLDNNNLRGEVE